MRVKDVGTSSENMPFLEEQGILFRVLIFKTVGLVQSTNQKNPFGQSLRHKNSVVWLRFTYASRGSLTSPSNGLLPWKLPKLPLGRAECKRSSAGRASRMFLVIRLNCLNTHTNEERRLIPRTVKRRSYEETSQFNPLR